MKFPNRIYVKYEDAGDGEEPFLLADKNLDSMADMGEVIPVGVYVLETTAKVTTKVVVE